MMIDVTDQGWVYNPKTQPDHAGVIGREDAIYGIRNLQISGKYILGDIDTKSFEHLSQETDYVDSYFVWDTQTGKKAEFKTYDELRIQAQDLAIHLKLEPINSVYSTYRFSWFDVFASLLFCIPPLLLFFALIIWIRRLRAKGMAPSFAA